jgi:hypothetical protein
MRQNQYGYKKCAEFRLSLVDFDSDMLIENGGQHLGYDNLIHFGAKQSQQHVMC